MAVQRQLYSGLDLYDWEGKGPNGRTKVSDIPKWQQNQEDIRHLPGAFPVQNVVITDGQITPTAAALAVDTEGGAPADDLTAIAPGDLHAGMLLALCSVDAGRKITIKSSAGASGIQTLDGKDVTLDTQYAVMLRLVSTESLTLWREEPGPLRLQLTVSTPDTLGGVKVQTGDNDGLEMIGDKLRARKANSTQRGSVLASETAQAGAVPLGGADGALGEDWLKKAMEAASAAMEAAEKAQSAADAAGGSNVKAYIIDTWEASDISSWYRKWSDGFIEQGGYFNNLSGGDKSVTTVTLPVAFSNTNYMVIKNLKNVNPTQDVSAGYLVCNIKSKNTFDVSHSTNYNVSSFTWYACGY